jgi:hypothetical protein
MKEKDMGIKALCAAVLFVVLFVVVAIEWRSVMRLLTGHHATVDLSRRQPPASLVVGEVLHAKPMPEVDASPIKITLSPDDVPKFKRSYVVTVGDGFKVEVPMYDTYYSRLERTNLYATLTSKDGRYILFNVHAVADKILDRELYPLVQAQVDRILAMDAEFVKSRPSEFTDESGQRWQRVATR